MDGAAKTVACWLSGEAVPAVVVAVMGVEATGARECDAGAEAVTVKAAAAVAGMEGEAAKLARLGLAGPGATVIRWEEGGAVSAEAETEA